MAQAAAATTRRDSSGLTNVDRVGQVMRVAYELDQLGVTAIALSSYRDGGGLGPLHCEGQVVLHLGSPADVDVVAAHFGLAAALADPGGLYGLYVRESRDLRAFSRPLDRDRVPGDWSAVADAAWAGGWAP